MPAGVGDGAGRKRVPLQVRQTWGAGQAYARAVCRWFESGTGEGCQAVRAGEAGGDEDWASGADSAVGQAILTLCQSADPWVTQAFCWVTQWKILGDPV